MSTTIQFQTSDSFRSCFGLRSGLLKRLLNAWWSSKYWVTFSLFPHYSRLLLAFQCTSLFSLLRLFLRKNSFLLHCKVFLLNTYRMTLADRSWSGLLILGFAHTLWYAAFVISSTFNHLKCQIYAEKKMTIQSTWFLKQKTCKNKSNCY